MLRNAIITSKNVVATIQDNGRYHFRHWGVNIGGAMDEFSFLLANQLAGNIDKQNAVLEIGNIPFSIHFSEEAFLGIAGTNICVILDGVVYYGNRSLHILPNQELVLPYQAGSQWKYLAVHKGWQTPIILGSRSTNKALNMDQLTNGSLISYFTLNESLSEKFIEINKRSSIIKITPGPEASFYDENILKNEFNHTFTISPQSNRMAYSFLEPLGIESAISIQSSAVCPGMVQLTPSGHFYILMKDCQTTGGYPRIGFLDKEHLNALTRLPFNEKVKFEFVE